MPIAMLVDNPEGSQELYEKIRQQLGLEAPAGGILHTSLGPARPAAGVSSRCGSRKRTRNGSSVSASAPPSRRSDLPAHVRSRSSGPFTTT